MRSCVSCFSDIKIRPLSTIYCVSCAEARDRLRDRIRSMDYSPLRKMAASTVSTAVKNGSLPPVRSCECVDCGKPATCYDHRDYAKPLDVVPVCKRCNKLRGSGKNAWIKGREPKKKRRVASITNIVKIFDSLDDSEKNEVLFKLEKRRPDLADAINQGEYDE